MAILLGLKGVSNETYGGYSLNDKKVKMCIECGKRFMINNNKNTSQIYCEKCAKKIKNKQNKGYYRADNEKFRKT